MDSVHEKFIFPKLFDLSEKSIHTDVTLASYSSLEDRDQIVRLEVHSSIVKGLIKEEKVVFKNSVIFFCLKNPEILKSFVQVLYTGRTLCQVNNDNLEDWRVLLDFFGISTDSLTFEKSNSSSENQPRKKRKTDEFEIEPSYITVEENFKNSLNDGQNNLSITDAQIYPQTIYESSSSNLVQVPDSNYPFQILNHESSYPDSTPVDENHTKNFSSNSTTSMDQKLPQVPHYQFFTGQISVAPSDDITTDRKDFFKCPFQPCGLRERKMDELRVHTVTHFGDEFCHKFGILRPEKGSGRANFCQTCEKLIPNFTRYIVHLAFKHEYIKEIFPYESYPSMKILSESISKYQYALKPKTKYSLISLSSRGKATFFYDSKLTKNKS